MRSRLALSAVALASALALYGCGGEQETPNAAENEAAAPAAELIKTVVRTAESQAVVTFRRSPEDIRILFSEGDKKKTLVSRFVEGRIRRYNERTLGTVATVRSNPDFDAFTVRSPEGDLHWRVRLGQSVVLIADHPHKPSFELRQSPRDTVRVLGADRTELGEVSFLADARVRVTDPEGNLVFKAKNAGPSAAYGVLAVPDLDPIVRYVLMAELLHRQR